MPDDTSQLAVGGNPILGVALAEERYGLIDPSR